MITLPLGWPRTLYTVGSTDLANNIGDLSVAITCAAAVMLIVLVSAAVITHERWPKFKTPLFTLITLVTVSTTLMLSSGAITLNINSPVGGSVRWGADYQIWACDNQLDLRDPHSLVGNRIGTPTLYEQNDSHIYYDGTPSQLPDDASLGKFMTAIGGEISDSSLIVPLNSQNGFVGTPSTPEQVQPYLSTDKSGALARFVDNQKCGDARAEVQVFVYSYNDGTKAYTQTKLDHPSTYELSHSKTSPPGDCVVIEFTPSKNRTDHLCFGYGIRDYDRCTQFGVTADKISSCDIRELR